MPLLLFIIFVGLVFSQLFLLPIDAKNTAISAFWAIISFANVYFWFSEDTSYFATPSEEQPFLHLWSLGVEEQFYILWPLLLILILKKDKGRLFLPIVCSIASLSFLFGEFAYEIDRSFTYYMLPSRIGELLIGAVTAYIVFQYKMIRAFLGRYVNTALSTICFAIICSSFFFISKDQTFPGLIAIPPTFSTGLLIFLGHQRSNTVKQLLSLPIFVWIGKLSYSAYLWHWLILAFYRYFYSSITLIDALIVLMSTFILSYFSYTYIEVPFRRSENGFHKVVTNQYLIPSTLISTIVLFSIMTNGYGLRNDRDLFLSEVVDESMEMKHPASFEYVCMPNPIGNMDLIDPRCVLGNNGNEVSKVMLWGDSNSTHYIGMIGSFAQVAKFTFRNIAIGSCPPTLSDLPYLVQPNCIRSKPILNRHITDYDVLIMSASWSTYQQISTNFIVDLKATLNSLVQRKKKVILLGKAPYLESYDRNCYKKAIRLPWLNCENQPYTISDNVIKINETLKQFADSSIHIEYYDFNKYICPTGTCNAYDEQGLPVYRDRSHLAIEASWRIGEKIIQTEGVPFPFSKIDDWLNESEHQ
jgi:peptidoglycan/LPS O-acetylase OafA/YrhL|tara:strand:- start:13 stop:1767 length:1755 start_codon:yes stop_codon:yes gene_type:complete